MVTFSSYQSCNQSSNMEAKSDAPLADFFGTLCAIFAKSASQENWAVARMMDVSSVSSHSPYFSGLEIVYFSLSYIHVCLNVCVPWFSWRFEIAYARIMSKIGVVSFCTFEKVVWTDLLQQQFFVVVDMLRKISSIPGDI